MRTLTNHFWNFMQNPLCIFPLSLMLFAGLATFHSRPLSAGILLAVTGVIGGALFPPLIQMVRKPGSIITLANKIASPFLNELKRHHETKEKMMLQENPEVAMKKFMEELLLEKEAAAELKCSVSKLQKWRPLKGPKFIQSGAQVLYRRRDLYSFLDSKVITPLEDQQL